MVTTASTIVRTEGYRPESGAATVESTVSGVSWGAILGGAFAAASVALILTALGSGLGLAAASPWANDGASAKKIAIAAIVWMVVVQWFSAGLGGYLTGRLRTKWVGLHTHEIFFRDTAHGFLAWAVGAVLGGFLLASAATSTLSGVGHAASAVASGAALGASQGATTQGKSDGPSAYFIDSLFRGEQPANAGSDREEAGRILVNGFKAGDVPADDRAYLAQLIASRTGISQPEAEQRVNNVIAQAKAAEQKAKEAADEARKAASKIAIFTALSMVIGAFIAATSAALGGLHRDEDMGAA